jgi:hypothetical protein
VNQRLLIALTMLVAVVAVVSIRILDPEKLSSFGSILSGAGSLLAVLWFSAGLRYQATQLEEQRKQFTAQFEHLQETSRRDALLVAKGILDNAEERAISQHGGITSITEIITEYMNFSEIKPLLESNNPIEVQDAFKSWIKKEGAAVTLLRGIKSAAEVYFRSVGISDIDYSKPPEEFVSIYSSQFSNQPFFDSLAGTATVLSEFMVPLAPARNAAQIAFLAATAKSVGKRVIKMDKLMADIEKHKADGYPLPKIAQDL